jgi:transcriptional regulator with XRE-family HTH domain
MQPLAGPRPSANTVVAKALERAAERLGLSDREVAAIVGVSPSSISRLFHGARTLDPDSKEGELALLLLRVFRSLDGLLGGHDEQSRQWLRAENHHLSGVPADLLQTAHGLVRVADYLDALRGHG